MIFCQTLRPRSVQRFSTSLAPADDHVVAALAGHHRRELAGQGQHLGAVFQIAGQLEAGHVALGRGRRLRSGVEDHGRILGQLVHVNDVGEGPQLMQPVLHPRPPQPLFQRQDEPGAGADEQQQVDRRLDHRRQRQGVRRMGQRRPVDQPRGPDLGRDTGENDEHQKQAQAVVGPGQGVGLLAGHRGVAGQLLRNPGQAGVRESLCHPIPQPRGRGRHHGGVETAVGLGGAASHWRSGKDQPKLIPPGG